MSSEEKIFGRRAVLEAIQAGNRRIEKILLARGLRGMTLREISDAAARQGIPIEECERKRIDHAAGSEHHQGVLAIAEAIASEGVSGILSRAHNAGRDPFVLVIDGVTDPQNLGAILRSAEAAGVHGVILPGRKSAPLDRATAKASAGAVEHIPISTVGNLGQAIRRLRDEGLRIWAAEASVTASSLWQADLSGGVALVIGSEGKGISSVVRERCDGSIRIPLQGRIASLNASAAAAIILFEVVRRRCGGGV
jgi:23S rRNA (guanosine2251-2'-O)-methyltransferase